MSLGETTRPTSGFVLGAVFAASLACGCGGSSAGRTPDSGTSSTSMPCYVAPGYICTTEYNAAGCAEAAGVQVPSCPTAGLRGCCKISGYENCYYMGDATGLQSGCMQGGGTFSTMP